MITIQRVRVRWDASARGAPHADARRGLDRPARLPEPLPPGDVVVHDVLADGHVSHADVRGGGPALADTIGFMLEPDGPALRVRRLPTHAAYPPGPARHPCLFTLLPGQVGRYRANFRMRFSDCACNPSWYYESWVVHVSNGPVQPDTFQHHNPDHDADHRVHLYGGRPRTRARIRASRQPH